MKIRIIVPLLILSLVVGRIRCQNIQINSGQINIGIYGSSIFYSRAIDITKIREKRLILWVNGGPGCSSLMGFFNGIGPYKIDGEGYVDLSISSLTDYGVLISVDQPFETGASILSPSEPDLTNFDDASTIYSKFIVKFLEQHVGYSSYQIILAGESMAGHLLPQTVTKLEKLIPERITDLKIFLISPWVDPVSHYQTFVEYGRENKMIDDLNLEEVKKWELTCLSGIIVIKSEIEVVNVINCYKFTDEITKNMYQFYDISINKMKDPSTSLEIYPWEAWINKMKSGKFNTLLNYKGDLSNFERCNNDIRKRLYVAMTQSVIDQYIRLYRDMKVPICVVSGKLDMISNYKSARIWTERLATMNNMVFSDIQSKFERKEISSKKEAGRLYRFEVENAGHMVGIKQSVAIHEIFGWFLEQE